VDDEDARLLVHLDDRNGRRTSSRLSDLDPFVDDDLGVLGVGRRGDGGEEGEVDGAVKGAKYQP
jgi:hypothetical protein